jgi:antitoxin CptB
MDETRRKRLLWRASHRGTREMDLVVGGFARDHIDALDARGLAELEAIVAIPDQELQAWILNQAAVPESHRSDTLMRLLAYRP